MSKEDQIQKVVPGANAIAPVPDWMKEEGTQGTEILRNYVVPPRLKVVQKSSNAEILKQFGVADLIVTPSLALVREMGRDPRGNATGEMTPVAFTPLFFFAEWAQWTDFAKRPQGMPSIINRTTDPTSPLRTKCTNAKLRTEPHPDDPTIMLSNVEHLNFIIVLHDHPLAGQPMLLSFARGEHQAGTKFAGLVQMRKGPLFGCVFEMKVAHRPGTGKGDWWGIDIMNPSNVPPWLQSPEQLKEFKELHEQFVKVHREGLIQASYDDETPGQEADPAAVKAVSEF